MRGEDTIVDLTCEAEDLGDEHSITEDDVWQQDIPESLVEGIDEEEPVVRGSTNARRHGNNFTTELSRGQTFITTFMGFNGVEVDECLINGTKLVPGMSVELKNGHFLRIWSILLGDEDKYMLKGPYLCSFMEIEQLGLNLPDWKNEVCWVHELTESDFPSQETANTRMVSPDNVIRVRSLHFTNRLHDHRKNNAANPIYLDVDAPLFCRFKYLYHYSLKVGSEKALITLSSTEADEDYSQSKEKLQRRWRGKTSRGGSREVMAPYITIPDDEDVTEVTSTLRQTHLSSAPPAIVDWVSIGRQYTLGDSFSGCGGISCGARAAGMSIKWGFDFAKGPHATFMKNFGASGKTDHLEASVEDALQESRTFLKVDVVHTSPVCKTFSAAHTTPGKDDAANTATLLSVRQTLKRAAPRVITMEETSGLLERHPMFLDMVLNDLVELGFSFRFKIVNLLNYGVPASRKRLILIAAA